MFVLGVGARASHQPPGESLPATSQFFVVRYFPRHHQNALAVQFCAVLTEISPVDHYRQSVKPVRNKRLRPDSRGVSHTAIYRSILFTELKAMAVQSQRRGQPAKGSYRLKRLGTVRSMKGAGQAGAPDTTARSAFSIPFAQPHTLSAHLALSSTSVIGRNMLRTATVSRKSLIADKGNTRATGKSEVVSQKGLINMGKSSLTPELPGTESVLSTLALSSEKFFSCSRSSQFLAAPLQCQKHRESVKAAAV